MSSISDQLVSPLTHLLFALADDKLMLGHRNSDWTGLGPILEEDIAFSALAQDEIGHAQALYEFVSELLGNPGGADELAFGRKPEEYRCASIVEVLDEFDWATAVVRKFFCDHCDKIRLSNLADSNYRPLADLCRRMAAEEQVHLNHVNGWMIRLGRGTDESRQRMQKAMDALAPHAAMLFESLEDENVLVQAGVYPQGTAALFDAWKTTVEAIAKQAGLAVNLTAPDPTAQGGRRGRHTQHFNELLDEMCEVYRIEPGAAW